ncbi:dicer-like protein 1 [Saccharata proteae CBS 121410]|uniref:Dicer-like protein 1 n=1 Tax=Saccharata proteae CBS 121410 TaxID=1314787 RepID=A0A9P4LVM5_9PEZI|nr:dicer-like protein 1 [Saccharata proteae CBS 121410]
MAKDAAEKRREQNALFKSWASKKAATVTKDEINEVKKAIQSADNEELSIRALLAKQESNKIGDPRDYQLELFERAKTENVIAVLDTGSGKTLIAVLLLRHILDQELEDRAAGKPPRISFFLVDSVTLVFQQFAVLETNLDHSIDRFCGAMGCDLWSKKTWDQHFDKNMVIVCTAEVLSQCLMHSFIRMDQINLLIFDEAHHAKKGHSYAKIIKDYYVPTEDLSKRPKIFGMTASPVDANVDVRHAARELETLLHCRIATTANMALLRKTISKPEEEVAFYPRLSKPFETPFQQKLMAEFADLEALKPIFETSKLATRELGAWCSDMLWSFALSEEEAKKLENRRELAHNREKGRAVEKLDAEVAQLRKAADFVAMHNFGTPKADAEHLSPKVLELVKWLSRFFERKTAAKCIVFVQRRHTARLLKAVFDHLGSLHLHCGLLVGSNSRAGDINIAFRAQVMTLLEFRKGGLNCLFATSVAEEGLDIPDCNLIIRFDLYTTMIQYVQSRGRARHRNSKYLHFLEEENASHRHTVMKVRQAESIMRKFCEALPEDRLLDGNEDMDLDGMILSTKGGETYKEPTTKALLTYDSALSVLAHFVGALRRQGDEILTPVYVMGLEAGKYKCEVILPSHSPVTNATGRPNSKKSMAKRSAAFEACMQLRRGGHLDQNLLPTIAKYLPAMRNAHLALNLKKKNRYDMMTKPSLYANTSGVVPQELYVTLVDFPEGLDRPHAPLAFLSRAPTPAIPPITLHMHSGKVTPAVLKPMTFKLKLREGDLERLNEYILRIFADLFNKHFASDLANMPYWLVPILVPASNIPPTYPNLPDIIDWNAVDIVSQNHGLAWVPDTPSEYLRDKFLVDDYDGGRRYFVVDVDPSLKGEDPVPEVNGRRRNMKNIFDWTSSLFNRGRREQAEKWDRSQPVLEARAVLHRRNMLAEPSPEEKTRDPRCYICPEPLKISAISTKVITSALVWPAIIHRIDEYFIAMEACDMLGLDIPPDLALEAMTKDSDNTEEHNEESVNFRRGMGNNYERLEFIGDCFLKMATSISLFGQNPDDNEFDFHVKRMLLICNQNLFDTAMKIELYKYIRSMAFNRRTWYPDGIKLIRGKGAKENLVDAPALMFKHSLGDKTVADVCEALIGAAYLAHNDKSGAWKPSDWNNAVRAVTKLVSSSDHTMNTWDQYLEAYTEPAFVRTEVTAAQKYMAEEIEAKHSYHFRQPKILRSAFIHPSHPFMWEKVPSYQRLEFLGDSLLDMVCINHLFYNYPTKDPQWLTEHKMAMVSNKFLGALCVRLGFSSAIRIFHSQVQSQITEYTCEVQEAERDGNGARDYWTAVKQPPKCLPDVLEAYVGAVFVDSGYNYAEVQRFFNEHMLWYFSDMTIYDSFANNHPTTHLQNLLAVDLGCQDFRIMATELPSVVAMGGPVKCVAGVMVHGKVVAEGFASSGKNAKIKAALRALDLLEGVAPFEFRRRFGCGCVAEEGKGESEGHVDQDRDREEREGGSSEDAGLAGVRDDRGSGGAGPKAEAGTGVGRREHSDDSLI